MSDIEQDIKDYRKKKQKEYYLRTIEDRRRTCKEYKARNREKISQYNKWYREKNREKIKEYNLRRKSGEIKMKRNISFKKVDGFNAMFDVNSEKSIEVEKKVNEMILENKSLASIILYVNENFGLSDNEWSNFMYGMGFVAGQSGAR